MTRQDALRIVNESIDDLFRNDLLLLVNDASERSITHKLAEYLQARVPNLNVDCEYNRNVQAPKLLKMIKDKRDNKIGRGPAQEVPEDVLQAYSTYPDIIIHRRGGNAANILVIEAKKNGSPEDYDLDFTKLCAFTGNQNEYRYEHGLFIRFETDAPNPQPPELIWFTNGQQDVRE